MRQKKVKVLRKLHQKTFGNTKALRYFTLPNGQVVSDKGRRVWKKIKIEAR